MGSGDWFKTIIGNRKTKQLKQIKGSTSEQPKTSKRKTQSKSKVSSAFSGNPIDLPYELKEIAARRIQTAFRGFRARKALRRLKGLQRLRNVNQSNSIEKQTSSTLSHLLSWNKIQTEIRSRRAIMVTEGRIKQKKLELQLKIEAKLQDIEADWCGGSETMEAVLSRVQQREEAAVKRERAMAYAFSHQWKASSGLGQHTYDIGKSQWGWSWTERWIAARPWEPRLNGQPTSPKKLPTKLNRKVNANSNKIPPPNKILVKPVDEKVAIQESNAKTGVTSSLSKAMVKHEKQQANGITI